MLRSAVRSHRESLEPAGRLIPGGPAGCLLFHGFSGSPLEMVPLAEALAEEGWTVSVARLAGHGTSPDELAGTTWQDWVASGREAYQDLRRRCSHVAVVGLSMGGALGLYLAVTEEPAAVVAINTPIRVRPLLATASRAASRMLPHLPVLFRLSPGGREMRSYLSPYNRIPVGLTSEVDRLLLATREMLPRLRMPLLIVQGRRDWVIPRDSGPRIVALARAAPASLLWLPRSGHVATLDRDRRILYDAVRGFLRSHLQVPEQQP